MTNIADPDYDQVRDGAGFTCRRAYVGRQAGARRLGLSLWDLPPGQTAYPYHFHLVEEEALWFSRERRACARPAAGAI